MDKKYVIASIFLICVTLISVTYAIQAKTGNPFDDFLRVNDWSYNEFRKMVNRGNFTEEIGSKLESISYVSYYMIYTNLDQLYNVSKLVIHGVVESSKLNVTFDAQGIDMPDVYTEFTIRIIDVLKGDYIEPTIFVSQMGGTYRGAVFRVKDDPLMKVGDEVVLYLNNRHGICGGPQGRFQIINGKLYNIAEIDTSIRVVSEALKTKGADAAHLRELLIP